VRSGVVAAATMKPLRSPSGARQGVRRWTAPCPCRCPTGSRVGVRWQPRVPSRGTGGRFVLTPPFCCSSRGELARGPPPVLPFDVDGQRPPVAGAAAPGVQRRIPLNARAKTAKAAPNQPSSWSPPAVRTTAEPSAPSCALQGSPQWAASGARSSASSLPGESRWTLTAKPRRPTPRPPAPLWADVQF